MDQVRALEKGLLNKMYDMASTTTRKYVISILFSLATSDCMAMSQCNAPPKRRHRPRPQKPRSHKVAAPVLSLVASKKKLGR
ncbi:hypothetical protein AAKU55_003895 [Oxalobacteraceae bacterium GrIS 1.11]